jgi:hypothetical protein
VGLNVFSYAQLAATGTYSGVPGFDRGFQTTTYCGNSPESWVRGSAWLDKGTGLLTMQVNLETDAIDAGPKGQVLVYIFDCNGNLVTRVASAEVGRGGKGFDGHAAIETVQSSTYLGPEIGRQACKMTVVANNTGFSDCWFNISFGQVNDGIGLVEFLISFF